MSLLTATLITKGLFLHDSRFMTWAVPLPSRKTEQAAAASIASVLVLIRRLRRLRAVNGGAVTVSLDRSSDRGISRSGAGHKGGKPWIDDFTEPRLNRA